MKYTAFTLLLIILLSCDSEAPSILNGDEQFSVKINNEYFIPQLAGSASYYKNNLSFGARDSIDQEGDAVRYALSFSIDNPALGVNTIGSTSAHIQLYRWEGQHGSSADATDGSITFTELDTVNGTFSGTFECIIIHPTEGFQYSLTEGQFTDITIATLFCEPETESTTADSVSIYNSWSFVGFQNPNLSFSYPPCGGNSSIKFKPASGSEKSVVQGNYPLNGFWGEIEYFSADSIILSDLIQTLVAGPLHEMDYEDQMQHFLSAQKLGYQTSETQLILTNEASELKMIWTIAE